MRALIAIFVCLLGGALWAQPGSDTANARAILRALEVDATAIRATNLPMDDVQRAATEMQGDVAQMPLLLAAPSSDVLAIEESMRAHVAQLIVVANSPDRFLSAGAADDLLGDIRRLRAATGLPR
jgi:hypothetical protein